MWKTLGHQVSFMGDFSAFTTSAQATALLEEHGKGLHAAGKSARILDRMAELLSDGNLKVCMCVAPGETINVDVLDANMISCGVLEPFGSGE